MSNNMIGIPELEEKTHSLQSKMFLKFSFKRFPFRLSVFKRLYSPEHNNKMCTVPKGDLQADCNV